MKTLYSILIVIVALFLFASLAIANPPFWDNQINNSTRFKVLNDFNNAAVYDKETGLVWEQSPLHPAGEETGVRTWVMAQADCNVKIVGNRRGWRLPTVQELASLLDPSNPNGNPDLPVGHPFSNVQRPPTGRLLPTSSLRAPRGPWTSAMPTIPVAAWEASLRTCLSPSGACAVDRVLIFSDLVI